MESVIKIRIEGGCIMKKAIFALSTILVLSALIANLTPNSNRILAEEEKADILVIHNRI